MTALDMLKAFYSRNFFKFTGPPENWLTAIKYMTWGLEQKYLENWKNIRIGDVFFMHSTGESLYAKRPLSSVVGLGVVGGRFRTKSNFLWIREIREKVNRWPLLVPFSEVYLFSELPSSDSWEAPGIGSDVHTPSLITALTERSVPISALPAHQFPVRGSIASVRQDLVERVLKLGQGHIYKQFYDLNQEASITDAVDFSVARDASMSVRHVPSLRFLEGTLLRERSPQYSTSVFERDNALLERAEENHHSILEWTMNFFRKRGFDTWFNQHVDLLAESKDRAFLIEVKSTVTNNFRTQARTAVGQLFEYEHFDVRRHFEKQGKTADVTKVLMVSNDPGDQQYMSFLNGIKICSGWSQGTYLSVSDHTSPLASLS